MEDGKQNFNNDTKQSFSAEDALKSVLEEMNDYYEKSEKFNKSNIKRLYENDVLDVNRFVIKTDDTPEDDFTAKVEEILRADKDDFGMQKSK